MRLLSNEYRDRLKRWECALREDFYRPLGVIRFEGFTTMEQLTCEAALRGDFAPLDDRAPWGRAWEYRWQRAQIVLPPEAQGEKIVMDVRPGGEATMFINSRPFGTRRAEWVNVPHHYIADNVLTDNGIAGERFDLLCEAYAGHYYPDAGNCATGPVLPGSFQDQKEEGSRCQPDVSTYGIWNEDAYQLWLDVSTLTMLMEALPSESLRAAKIAEALERYTLTVDFEQEPEGRKRDYRAARASLRPLMAAHNGSTAPLMTAVGNAHLDMAWLWPLQETARKTARTFAAQLRLLKRYPEYVFLQSQPASYELCRQWYPSLYREIGQAVRDGRWIAEGAMYVEPDTNMPSGESLIRQLLYGKRFFKEELGVDSRLLWLPDTFGYTAALPQILKGCHVDYLVTQKIFWSYNGGDAFPYHYFHWKGMDGSVVTAFLPTSYTYRTDPAELCGVWRARTQARGLDDFLIPFGYGDGGGGPCRDDVEYVLRERDLEGMPRVTMESPVRFFDRLKSEGGPANTWEGELYFDAHRGTYTSQAAVKRNNRRGEFGLREAELWCSLAAVRGEAYPREALTRLWKTLLLNQFHDILPGSSIARVYAEANASLEALQKEAETLADTARKTLLTGGEGITVFNSLGFEREAVVSLPGQFVGGARTPEGDAVPTYAGKALVRVPALGGVSLVPAEQADDAVPLAHAELNEDGAILYNDEVSIRLNHLGEVTSYRTKNGREYAASPMNRLLLFKDVPRKFDAWDIDANYREQPVVMGEDATVAVQCDAGLTVAVTVTRHFGESVLTQHIMLNAKGARLSFDTGVEWREMHRLLKVAFPVTVQNENALHEMQFGFVQRPTHRSRSYDRDRFEVCNHRYTALCDNGRGCAVLNDCKYGVGVEGNSMELTLLRASTSPEMRADNGFHRFTYAFTAWEGPFLQCPVVREGLELNVPPAVLDGCLPAFGAFSVDRENVIIDTVKLAEDGSGDMLLRLYESKEADTEFALSTALPVADAWLCDMMENKEKQLYTEERVIRLHAGPFQILTLRLRLMTDGQ